MKKIFITKSKFVLVDNKNFENLNKYKWFYNGGYASRNKRFSSGIWKNVFMHHEIIGNIKNWKVKQIDHINNDKLDNRVSNLRIVTVSQNAINRPFQKNNESGFKGVFWQSKNNKWRAQINCNKKRISLGMFKNPKEAALFYNQAAIKYFGKYAYLNEVAL
jgi:hypothetical protein